MANKPPEVHKWYTQDAKEFRKTIWRWLSDGSQGGELKRLFDKFLRRRQLRHRMVEVLKSKTMRATAVVLVIAFVGYLIQKEEGESWQKTIFKNLESIALGSAGIIFLLEIKDRQKRDHYEAWQMINSAWGQTGNGGRIEALEDLHRDGVNLEGVSAPGADLSGIDLRGANLRGANLISAKLEGAKLDGANLSFAQLTLAKMRDCELRGANLWGANLEKADLQDSKLQDAKMGNAKMKKADLSKANLQGAHLQQADLEDALLPCANLQKTNLAGTCLKNAILQKAKLQNAYMLRTGLKEAYLEGAELEGTCIFMTDLKEAKGITHDQLAQSILYQAILPEGITIEPSLDYTDLGIDPQDGNFLEDFEEYPD